MAGEEAVYADDETEGRNARKRKLKLMAALFLTLMIGMLVLVLLWLLLFRPTQAPEVAGDGILEPLFSIYGLQKPFGVATDEDRNIYVTDNGTQRLLVFDDDGNFVRRIGEDEGRSKLYSIAGVDVDDAKDRVYVADFALRQVFAFNKQGELQFRFPKQPGDPAFGGLRFSPYDVDTYGDRIFVTSNDGVYIFDTEGNLMEKWGSKGANLGFFNFPNGIAVDPKSGAVYVGDILNRRVVAMDQTGLIKWAVGQSDLAGQSRSYFGLPRGVAVDPAGNVWVADTLNFRLTIIDPDGNLVSIGGARGVEDGLFNFPEGIDINADGTVLVADRENNRVEALRLRNPDAIAEADPEDQAKYNESLARPGVGGTDPIFVNVIDFQGFVHANEDPAERLGTSEDDIDESISESIEELSPPGPSDLE